MFFGTRLKKYKNPQTFYQLVCYVGMKTLVAIIISILLFAPIAKTKAQRIDSLDYVSHNGVVFLTQNKSTLTFSQIKNW